MRSEDDGIRKEREKRVAFAVSRRAVNAGGHRLSLCRAIVTIVSSFGCDSATMKRRSVISVIELLWKLFANFAMV